MATTTERPALDPLDYLATDALPDGRASVALAGPGIQRVNLTVAIPPLLLRNEIATVRPGVM